MVIDNYGCIRVVVLVHGPDVGLVKVCSNIVVFCNILVWLFSEIGAKPDYINVNAVA